MDYLDHLNHLGYTHKKPSQKENGKWNYVDVILKGTEEFNEATTKIMNLLYKNDSNGICTVLDGKGNNYMLEIIHATFDTNKNIIKVLPFNCTFLDQNSKTNTTQLQNNERRQTARTAK